MTGLAQRGRASSARTSPAFCPSRGSGRARHDDRRQHDDRTGRRGGRAARHRGPSRRDRDAPRAQGADLGPVVSGRRSPIARRRARIAIPERLDFEGNELLALDEDAVRAGIRRLRQLGAESIAVMFLFSFVNPAHERRARELILEEYPDVGHISLSHEVMPRGPEFERTSTTLVNAYVAPRVSTLRQAARRASPRGGLRGRVADHGVDRRRDAAGYGRRAARSPCSGRGRPEG